MSKRQLPDWLDGFLEYTKRVESPEPLRLWTGISTIAAVMQRKCAITYGEETWFPNMYIVLIAPAAQVRKSTIMRRAKELLEAIGQVNISPNAVTKQRLIRLVKQSKTEDFDPTTGEAVAEQCPMTIFSGELTVFLGYQDKEFMTMLADWYDCDTNWRYETKHPVGGSNIDSIHNIWINLAGATTPQLFLTAVPREFVGGGLASRMIFVYEEQGILIKGNIPRNKELKQLLINDLQRMRLIKGMFKTTKGFDKVWEKFREDAHKSPPFRGNPMFDAYVSRRAAHIAKLSMILHASYSDTTLVDDKDINKAITILKKAETKMHYVFGGVGESPQAALIYKVQRIIAKKGVITIGELQKHLVYDCDNWRLDKILEVLITSRFIDRPFGVTIGTPAATIKFRKKDNPSFGLSDVA